MGTTNVGELVDLSKHAAGGAVVGKAVAVSGLSLSDKLDLAANEMFVGIMGAPIAAFAASVGASLDGPIGAGTAICGIAAVVATGLALHGAGVLIKDQFDSFKEKFGWGKASQRAEVPLHGDLAARLAQKRSSVVPEPSASQTYSGARPMGA